MKSKLALFAVPVVILLALGGAGAYWVGNQNPEETDGDLTQVSLNEPASNTDANIETAAGDEALPQDLPAPEGIEQPTISDAPTPAAPAPEAPAAAEGTALQGPISTPSSAPVSVIVEGTDPKQPRTLGQANAPVTMYDYSSLTCPHCAHAHETILPLLIRDYVQTGKLRIVFSDFPLNAEAIEASKISRCMPGDKYYNFVSLLFSSVDQWAPNVPQSLVQYAVLAGLSKDKAEACLADKDVENALIQGVQDAATQHQVAATPTFIFNDGKKVIQGARPYLEFQMAIDGLIEEGKDAAKATTTPSTTPAQ